jgi:A/G-specific adenine glycosylase
VVATSRSSSSLLAGTNEKALFGALFFLRSPMPASSIVLAPLTHWFATEARRLPWRAENLDLPHPDPYAVLVSELMLQQTRVATVVPYFHRWMARFPDPLTLSLAGDDEVHKLWEGLGYYRRARFLKQTATRIAQEGWPRDLQGLQALPGLGPYTAAAIAAIAFQRPEPALDGNAFRVLARLLGLQEEPRRHAAELREWLRPGLAAHGPSRITQAIMELGATLCGARPDCAHCPLAASCVALRLGITDRIPPAMAPAQVKTLDIWLVAIEAEAQWLLCKPAARGLLAGLWRWPTQPIPQDQVSGAAAEASIPYRTSEARTWPGWTQLYSHRQERVTPVAISIARTFTVPHGGLWVPHAELAALPFGKRDQRLRNLLCEPGLSAHHIPVPELLQQVMAKAVASEPRSPGPQVPVEKFSPPEFPESHLRFP